MNSREVVIVEAVRTPIGRGHKEKGYYKDLHPAKLLAACCGRSSIGPGSSRLDVGRRHLWLCHAVRRADLQHRPHGLLLADLPYEVPGTTVDRQCGSAQQAINFGAAMIASGVSTSSSAPASSTWATTR